MVAVAAGTEIRASALERWQEFFDAEVNREASTSDARSRALDFLIHEAWIRREAARKGIEVDAAEIQDALRVERSAVPAGDADDSGNEDGEERLRAELTAILEKLRAEAFPLPPMTESRLRDFYRVRRARFFQRRARSLRAVQAASREEADRARRDLARGLSWREAIERHGINPTSGKEGGRVVIDVANTIGSLKRAVFDASKETIVGPINIEGAWWVFQVDRDIPRRQRTFADVRSQLPAMVRASWEKTTFEKLVRLLNDRYRRQTTCDANYTAPSCRAASQG